MVRLAALVLALAPVAASAVTVDDCGSDGRSDILSVAEPWEANTRTYANGNIRLVVTDTIEPAFYPVHLVVLHPPYVEAGMRSCHVVSFSGTLGFDSLDLRAATSGYDPTRGSTAVIPATGSDDQGGGIQRGDLAMTINQASGSVGARFGWR